MISITLHKQPSRARQASFLISPIIKNTIFFRLLRGPKDVKLKSLKNHRLAQLLIPIRSHRTFGLKVGQVFQWKVVHRFRCGASGGIQGWKRQGAAPPAPTSLMPRQGFDTSDCCPPLMPLLPMVGAIRIGGRVCIGVSSGFYRNLQYGDWRCSGGALDSATMA